MNCLRVYEKIKAIQWSNSYIPDVWFRQFLLVLWSLHYWQAAEREIKMITLDHIVYTLKYFLKQLSHTLIVCIHDVGTEWKCMRGICLMLSPWQHYVNTINWYSIGSYQPHTHKIPIQNVWQIHSSSIIQLYCLKGSTQTKLDPHLRTALTDSWSITDKDHALKYQAAPSVLQLGCM